MFLQLSLSCIYFFILFLYTPFPPFFRNTLYPISPWSSFFIFFLDQNQNSGQSSTKVVSALSLLQQYVTFMRDVWGICLKLGIRCPNNVKIFVIHYRAVSRWSTVVIMTNISAHHRRSQSLPQYRSELANRCQTFLTLKMASDGAVSYTHLDVYKRQC